MSDSGALLSQTAVSTATKAFSETLELLHLPENTPEFRDPVALGRRAALLAVAETAWGQVLGPLYDLEQAKSVLGEASSQGVHDLGGRKKLLALDGSGGRKLYPAFQFTQIGRPFASLCDIITIFEDVVETPYTIAVWFVSPQGLLGGQTPAAWLRAEEDPGLLLESARRSAEELAR